MEPEEPGEPKENKGVQGRVTPHRCISSMSTCFSSRLYLEGLQENTESGKVGEFSCMIQRLMPLMRLQTRKRMFRELFVSGSFGVNFLFSALLVFFLSVGSDVLLSCSCFCPAT